MCRLLKHVLKLDLVFIWTSNDDDSCLESANFVLVSSCANVISGVEAILR